MPHLPFNDREVERVLAGQQPYGRPELADVAYFVARLRTLADFEPPPEMSPELRAQVEAAESPDRQVDGHRRRRRTRHTAPVLAADLGVVRLDTRRRQARKARVVWRAVGAAAVVLAVGGIITASLHSPSEPEVETEPVPEAGPTQEPTTTAGATDSPAAEPPVASPGESPARPTDVPSEPPGTQVESGEDIVADPESEDEERGMEDPPEWAEDFWPRECSWEDWACACESYDFDPRSRACRGLENQLENQNEP